MKTTFELNGKTLSRTQLLLRLAWAVTIHKSQGLTLDRIKLGLGKKEFSTGLTFVALSRVKKPDGIMIVDRLDFSRVQKLSGKHLQHQFDDYACRYPRNMYPPARMAQRALQPVVLNRLSLHKEDV